MQSIEALYRQLPEGFQRHPEAGGALAAATLPVWALPAAAYGAYKGFWQPYGLPAAGRAAQAVAPFIPEPVKRGGMAAGGMLLNMLERRLGIEGAEP